MTVPFYVSPEQLIKDKADYARKGIARGRSVVVLQYDGGIVFVAENPSRALHKISEIYDRIAFAAVGKYNEFENLRVAGVRFADLRGYSYDRSDVTVRSLANAYAQTLGTIFTETPKPYEVEIVVAEVGATARGRPDVPADVRRVRRRRARVRRDGRVGGDDQRRAHGAVDRGHVADRRAAPGGRPARGCRRERRAAAPSRPRSSRSPSSTAPGRAAPSGASPARASPNSSTQGPA